MDNTRKVVVLLDGYLALSEKERAALENRFQIFEDLGAAMAVDTDESFLKGWSSLHEAIRNIETKGPGGYSYEQHVLDSVKDAEVILAHFNPINRTLMDAAPKLKMIGVMRSGVENVDLEAARERGIAVCSSPGRVSEPVADYTLGIILSYYRKISSQDMSNTKKWTSLSDEELHDDFIMSDLTFGLIGFGIIGQKVAKRLHAFGSTVIAYDPYANPRIAQELGVKLLSLEEVLSTADAISVHARLTEDTANLIGAREFALMKPTAAFFNTARAGLVDEGALIDALQTGKIAGAGLDVYVTEPLPENSPFFQMDNVVLMPHKAGVAGDYIRLTTNAMREEVSRYLKGETLQFSK